MKWLFKIFFYSWHWPFNLFAAEYQSDCWNVFCLQISDDCGDRIVNDALELWTKNGSCLLMPKSDSPAVNTDTKGKGWKSHDINNLSNLFHNRLKEENCTHQC